MSVIFGGLSLLNLIVDLSPISLNGKLLEWSKAYDALVESFVRPLFAWIHLYWISISTGEMHLLVIQSILIAGYIRASLHWGYLYEGHLENSAFALGRSKHKKPHRGGFARVFERVF